MRCALLLLGAALFGQQLPPEQAEIVGVAKTAVVAVSGQRFREALRIETERPGGKVADAQLGWRNEAAAEEGARLRLSFWVRKLAPEDRFNVRGRVRVEETGGDVLLETVYPVNTPVWTFYAFDLVARKAYEPGTIRIVYLHGQGQQTYELGGVEWVNRGPAPGVEGEGERVGIVGDWTRSNSYFDNASGGGSARVVDVEGKPFSRSMRITTNGPSGEIFRAALSWVVDRGFSRGDVMHVSFWVRRVSGIEPLVLQAIHERNGGNFSKSLAVRLPREGTGWQRIQAPYAMDDTYASGGSAFRFLFGGGPQVIEIADVVLLHFGGRATVSQLPVSTWIPNQRSDAAWRKEAAEGIERHRKANLQVKVVREDGTPVVGARVEVQQLKHAFRYGSAVVAAGILGGSSDDAQYRSRIESHFTTTVLENDLKWPFWEANSSFPQARTRAAVAWLEERRIPLRGHVLVWGGWRNLPADLPGLSAEALRARIDGHIRRMMTDVGLAGKIYHWDVQNEPFDNFDLQGRIGGVPGVTPSTGVLGNEEPLRWFELAIQLGPEVKRYLNDYNQFEGGTTNGTQLQYTMAYLRLLKERKAAGDGFGFQSHFGGPVAMEVVSEVVKM